MIRQLGLNIVKHEKCQNKIITDLDFGRFVTQLCQLSHQLYQNELQEQFDCWFYKLRNAWQFYDT